MSTILVDTNVIINAPALASLMSAHRVKASLITRGELVFGVRRAERSGNAQAAKMRRLVIDTLDNRRAGFWLPFDHACTESYGMLADVAHSAAPAKARSKDALIAATAHAYGLPLYTSNIKDFQVFGELISVVKV
ncbi:MULTISPECIES: PIN domain-containing protein [unclassified Microbacterium]|uniref:PIN domain-containing protein n=1 Tax=unclassified Microbacterium TaxID=2609290 RepID=UPI00300F9A5D